MLPLSTASRTDALWVPPMTALADEDRVRGNVYALLGNLLADLAAPFIDPRIKLR